MYLYISALESAGVTRRMYRIIMWCIVLMFFYVHKQNENPVFLYAIHSEPFQMVVPN